MEEKLAAMQESSAPVDSGQVRLEEMGYKQELRRDLTLMTNFFLSFAGISILSGITTLFNTGLIYGGPSSYIYGWLVAGFLNCLIALSMAEICSAYPTSGGLYYWSYSLAGPKWGPFASWITGWFNLIGQIVNTCSVDFSLALLLQTIILLSTGGANGGGYYASKYVVLGMHGGIILSQALVNCFAVSWLGRIVTIAAAWNFISIFVFMFGIPLVAVERASPEFVFTSFNKDNGLGIHSFPYILALSLLLVQYSISGYDCSAHMSEETKQSDKGSAYALVASVVICVVLGWFYLVGISFAAVNPDHLLDTNNDAGGYAMAQMFYDAFRDRYNSGTGGIACLGVAAGAIYFCGNISLTTNSRMLYAFARDGAVPLSKVWRLVDRNNVPFTAVWLSALISFSAALTSLGSIVAFQATVSISTIGLYLSYGIPILFRITIARKDFLPGPFHLGRWSQLVGTVSVLWIAAIAIIFCLPVAYPVTSQTLNYAPFMVGGVLVFAVGDWYLNARFWFHGPSMDRKSQCLTNT